MINTKAKFKTDDISLKKYNNQECEIVKLLTESKKDIEEIGIMYKVKFDDNYTTEVFKHELI